MKEVETSPGKKNSFFTGYCRRTSDTIFPSASNLSVYFVRFQPKLRPDCHFGNCQWHCCFKDLREEIWFLQLVNLVIIKKKKTVLW